MKGFHHQMDIEPRLMRYGACEIPAHNAMVDPICRFAVAGVLFVIRLSHTKAQTTEQVSTH